MALDFSSDTAWRRLKLMLKLGVGGFLLAAALAIPMNAAEGRPMLPSYMLTAGPVIFLLFMSPWFLWWAFLRLSESTLKSKAGAIEREAVFAAQKPHGMKRLIGPAVRAVVATLPLAWLIYHASQGGHDLYIVWILFSAMAIGGVGAFVAGVLIELKRRR